MKIFFKCWFVVLFTLFSHWTSAEMAKLPEGKEFIARLMENVNGNFAPVGKTVLFQVIEDVAVDGKVVIAKDTIAYAKIYDAKASGRVGKGGNMLFSADHVEAVDGQKIDLDPEPIGVEGKSRTGGTIALGVLISPLALLAKGRAAFVLAGAEYEFKVGQDSNIVLSSGLVKSQKKTPQHKILSEFDRYKKAIKYAKGKKGKDFIVKFTLPEYLEGLHPENPKSVRLVNFNGFDLPDSIPAAALEWNDEDKILSATFNFWDVVRFASPEGSKIDIELVLMNQEVAASSAHLEARWVLK